MPRIMEAAIYPAIRVNVTTRQTSSERTAHITQAAGQPA